ncbi:MAG TPA: hypothetical protein DCR20_01590 [Planctomycetaceae bacterium]|jgi:hypothetical protein|nr:hypothetical protein [Planctomycetaceae bacterium]
MSLINARKGLILMALRDSDDDFGGLSKKSPAGMWQNQADSEGEGRKRLATPQLSRNSERSDTIQALRGFYADKTPGTSVKVCPNHPIFPNF